MSKWRHTASWNEAAISSHPGNGLSPLQFSGHADRGRVEFLSLSPSLTLHCYSGYEHVRRSLEPRKREIATLSAAENQTCDISTVKLPVSCIMRPPTLEDTLVWGLMEGASFQMFHCIMTCCRCHLTQLLLVCPDVDHRPSSHDRWEGVASWITFPSQQLNCSSAYFLPHIRMSVQT